MIALTRINRVPVVINADLIISVESTPDTVITLLNGDRMHVREAVSEVVELAIHYQRRIHLGDLAAPSLEGGGIQRHDAVDGDPAGDADDAAHAVDASAAAAAADTAAAGAR